MTTCSSHGARDSMSRTNEANSGFAFIPTLYCADLTKSLCELLLPVLCRAKGARKHRAIFAGHRLPERHRALRPRGIPLPGFREFSQIRPLGARRFPPTVRFHTTTFDRTFPDKSAIGHHARPSIPVVLRPHAEPDTFSVRGGGTERRDPWSPTARETGVRWLDFYAFHEESSEAGSHVAAAFGLPIDPAGLRF